MQKAQKSVPQNALSGVKFAKGTGNQVEVIANEVRPNSHRTRDATRTQIGTFFLWCCLPAVWTLPLTITGPICLRRVLRPVWIRPESSGAFLGAYGAVWSSKDCPTGYARYALYTYLFLSVWVGLGTDSYATPERLILLTLTTMNQANIWVWVPWPESWNTALTQSASLPWNRQPNSWRTDQYSVRAWAFLILDLIYSSQ